MLKEGMAAHRLSKPVLLFSLVLTVAGCSKTGPNNEPGGPATVAPKIDVAGSCDAAKADALIAGIASDEAAKTRLEETAKNAPEKENFRKLYDAEVAFASATDAKLAQLTTCGAAAATLLDVKNKVAKSRANVTYLSENFPDFK